jgi:hypothetical protein
VVSGYRGWKRIIHFFCVTHLFFLSIRDQVSAVFEESAKQVALRRGGGVCKGPLGMGTKVARLEGADAAHYCRSTSKAGKFWANGPRLNYV